MNNYLLQLLKEVKTLIIPGLGALTVTNEATGEIMFMPYLKYDDGTLAQHIATKEGMEVNDAKNLIAKFVREVTVVIDKGDSYDMYEFGSFRKIEGEIAFEKWNSGVQNLAPEVKNESETNAEAIHTEPEITPIEEKIAETPSIESENTTPVDPITVEPQESHTKEEIEEKVEVEQEQPVIVSEKTEEKVEEKVEEKEVAPVAEEKVVNPAPQEEIPAETKPEVSKDTKASAEKSVKSEQPKKAKPAPKEKGPKKKTSVFAYVLWGVFVMILGSGAYIFINYDNLKQDFPILADLAGETLKPIEDSSTSILEDEPEMNIDTETNSEPLPEEEIEGLETTVEATPPKPSKTTEAPVSKPVPSKPAPAKPKAEKPKVEKTAPAKPVKKSVPVKQADGSLPFHIIAGSFGSEANAKRLANSLQAKGFSSASVAQNNGMYRVSVQGYSTLAEATTAAKNMQGDVPGAWVLKM